MKALCIAHFYPMKGLSYLIEAAKIVRDRGVSFSLAIVGDGEERKTLQELIRHYGLEDVVSLAGEDSRLASNPEGFDLYIQSSLKEGFPYTILEAMAAGLPIVATAVGGVPEAIIHEETGLLARPADAEDLAEKIICLAQDPALAQRLGERTKAKVSKDFTLETMLEKTRAVYLGLLRQ
ncbi:glycosyltransferase [Candidatus Azambacteria bacterium]|nr:glycosyltransferase [Candidatus Azambacteria bacterium]